MSQQDDDNRPVSFMQAAISVLAAFFGVQNRRNRERDFTRGRVSHFIVLGVIFTALLVVAVIVAVRLTLKQAGV